MNNVTLFFVHLHHTSISMSQFELPFIEYISGIDRAVCIGVPHGTALWQVGDSKEKNRSFKMELTEVKHDLLKKKLYIAWTMQ